MSVVKINLVKLFGMIHSTSLIDCGRFTYGVTAVTRVTGQCFG